MIRFFFASLCALIGGCADAALPAAGSPATSTAPAAATVRDIDVATLKADLDRGAVSLLVDVRTPGEFAGGHVPGARNIPLDELDARLGEFGAADSEVYVICQSGGRSARASAALAAKGLHPVNVTGGTGAWVSAGLPVEE
jgi:rhodanese-related sulfurtransferase